jgi:enoyl-CoA hydratase/carnithine racemase
MAHTPAAAARVVDRDHVRVVTLARPERKNAFNQDLYLAVADALADAASDTDVHCVVVTGDGTAFSSGQDLAEMAAIADGTSTNADGFTRLLEQLESFPKPLIAAVNGPAVGIGMTMLLHCDIVVVAHSARLRVPFSELGVPPEAGSSALLADRIGWQRAAEVLFTSRWIDAETAVEFGLAVRAVPDDELMLETSALATTIARQSPDAVATAKRLMLAARGARAEDARDRESTAFATLFAQQRDENR